MISYCVRIVFVLCSYCLYHLPDVWLGGADHQRGRQRSGSGKEDRLPGVYGRDDLRAWLLPYA